MDAARINLQERSSTQYNQNAGLQSGPPNLPLPQVTAKVANTANNSGRFAETPHTNASLRNRPLSLANNGAQRLSPVQVNFLSKQQIVKLLEDFKTYCENGLKRPALQKLEAAVNAMLAPINHNIQTDRCELINIELGAGGSMGYRAAHYAAWRGYHEAFSIMARVPGFNPEIKNAGGYRPIHTAICQLSDKDPQLVAVTCKALLEAGASANGTTNRLCCPCNGQFGICAKGDFLLTPF